MLDKLISSFPSSWSTRPQTELERREIMSSLKEKQFFSAVKSGDRKKFLWYLQQGYPVDMVESHGVHKDTALISACRLGKTDIVHIALEYDAKNDPHPEYGQTALQVAVAFGHCESAQLILETAALSKADHIIVNHEDASKEAPVHVASRCGNLQMLELLLKHGAIITLVDAKGRTCLHCAAQAGHYGCLHILLQAGGEDIINERDGRGLTPLHISVMHRNSECTRLLLECGADVNISTPEGFSSIQIAKKTNCRKTSCVLLQYGSKARVFQGHNLFEGLQIFQRGNEPRYIDSQLYEERNSGRVSMHSMTYQNNTDKPRNAIYHTLPRLIGVQQAKFYSPRYESFFHEDEEWLIVYHESGFPYFFRVSDSLSQWDDPRTSSEANIYPCTRQEGDLMRCSDSTNTLISDTVMEKASVDDGRDHNDVEEFEQIKCIERSEEPLSSCFKDKVIHESDEHQHLDCKKESLSYALKRISSLGEEKVPSAGIHQKVSNKFVPSRNVPGCEKAEESKTKARCVELSTRTSGFLNNLASYKKMLSVGVPYDAVILKMKKDGINGNVIESFSKTVMGFDNLKNIRSQDAVSTNFTTSSSNLEQGSSAPVNTVQSNTPNSTDNQSINECNSRIGADVGIYPDDKLSKYRKMLSVGVPFDSIIHKMSADGIDEVRIKAFHPSSGWHKINVLNQNGKDPDAVMKAARDAIKGDELFAKYNKMAAVGVPSQSIVNKMRQDGIDKDKIDTFECAYNLKRGRATALSTHRPPQKPSRRRTSIAMQKIHWNTISTERLSNSLWAIATDNESTIDDSEVKQLESLFGAKETNSSRNKQNNIKHKVGRSSLIDMKRSNNIAIALAQFKLFHDYDELCSSVSTLDSSKISREQLENMTPLLPTEDELRKVKENADSSEGLGRAEMFFIAVSKIPRFTLKLKTFIFLLQFSDHERELKDALSKLDAACKAIISNRKLAAILKRLLAIGNLVNEGAGKSKAAGITIDSLLKIANRAGSDGKTKVIDVVLANFLKNDTSGDVVNFWTEIKCVNVAARIEMHECKNSFRDLTMGIRKVETNVEHEEKALSDGDASESSVLFLQRCKDFIEVARKTSTELEELVRATESSFENLCTFFAEDVRTCKASSIFGVVIRFASIVQNSTDSWARKAKAAQRKHQMSAPIKASSRRVPREEIPVPERKESNTLSRMANNEKEKLLYSMKAKITSQSYVQYDSDNDSWDSNNKFD